MNKKIIAILLMFSFLLTSCGKTEEAVSETEDSGSTSFDYSSYIGSWDSKDTIKSGTDEVPQVMLFIEEVDEEFVTFSIVLPQPSGKLCETNEITAEGINGKASFTYKDSQSGIGTGVLTFRDDSIIVQLTTADDGSSAYDISLSTKVYVRDEDSHGAVEDSGDENTTVTPEISKEEPTSITSIYFPVNGVYNNGSSGDYEYIEITMIDQSSFKFAIYRSGSLIFNEHIAVFEEQDSTIAVYRGQNYTLFFDCSEYATITLTGFEDAVPAPRNTFWNSTVLQSS